MGNKLSLSQYRALIGGEIARVELSNPQHFVGLFAGSFNPFHHGHKRIVDMAGERLGGTVAIELSLVNVEKAPITFEDVESRIRQIESQCDSPVIVSAAPDFLSKSKLFPKSVFVVGADTIMRVADPRFYQWNERLRDQAFKAIKAHGCRFLVFGRLMTRQFIDDQSADLPAPLRAICDFVSEESFRVDISSSDLRREDLHGDTE